jgi:hypothetical protein
MGKVIFSSQIGEILAFLLIALAGVAISCLSALRSLARASRQLGAGDLSALTALDALSRGLDCTAIAAAPVDEGATGCVERRA